MAQNKIELTGKTDQDLKQELSTMESELQQMHFDHAVKGLGNPMELRALRRNIARVNTELRRRELEAMAPEQLLLRSKLRARRRQK